MIIGGGGGDGNFVFFFKSQRFQSKNNKKQINHDRAKVLNYFVKYHWEQSVIHLKKRNKCINVLVSSFCFIWIPIS